MYTGAWYHILLIARANSLKVLGSILSILPSCDASIPVVLVRLSNDLAMRIIEKWKEQRDKVCSFLSSQGPGTGPNAMFGGRYSGLL